MKAVSFDRCIVSFVLALVLIVVAAVGISSVVRANPAASPVVGKASPADLWKFFGAKVRAAKPVRAVDVLKTPLADINPYSGTSPAGDNPEVVSSTAQTDDITLPTESPSSTTGLPAKDAGYTNVDPTWSPDEQYIVFASNRSSDGLFHLYAIPSAGGVTAPIQLTSTDNNERWPSMISSTQIVYCASSSASGPYSLYLASITSTDGVPTVDTATASLLVSGTTLDCEHPSYGSGSIVFAGRTSLTAKYHIWLYDIADGSKTQLTTGVGANEADEENPAFSANGDDVAFDSDATNYTSTGTSPGLRSLGVTSSPIVRNIFVSNLSGESFVQFTSPAGSGISSVEPAWATIPTGSPVGNTAGTYIFFASNRTNSHYGIWYLNAAQNAAVGYGIPFREGVDYTAVNVQTSDPVPNGSVANTYTSSTGEYNNFEPAVPSFNLYYSVVYSTARFLINGISDNPLANANPAAAGADLPYSAPAYPNLDVEPANTAPDPAGVFGAAEDGSGATELSPTGGFEVMNSQLFDIDAPSLLRYDTSEIVHTEDFTLDSATGTPTTDRQVTAGDRIKFVVRLSDRQTGVGQVYIQIKNPNSKYQVGSSGLEHKVFTLDTASSGLAEVPTSTLSETGNPIHPNANEATTLFDLGADYRYMGLDSICGIAGANAIFAGHIVTSAVEAHPAVSIPATYPTDGVAGQAEMGSINVPPVTTLSLKDVQNLTDAYSFNHLTGDILALYDYQGNYVEEVQVVSSNYNLEGTPPISGTFTVTPIQNAYAIPTGVTASNPGYAVVVGTSSFDPMGQETDCEAIAADTAGQVNATLATNFSIPRYLPGFDDQDVHSGDGIFADASDVNGHVPVDANNGDEADIWLPLTPVPASDPLYDTNGGTLYEATWLTPQTPSDYYVDVIAYDNANVHAQNWRIYDNVWGFTTQPFTASTVQHGPGGILLVNDYMLPQKFFSGRFGTLSPSNIPENYFGAESYLTDVDVSYADEGGQLACAPDCAFDTNGFSGNQTTAMMSQFYHRPDGTPTDTFGGDTYAPFYPNTLGVNSYHDSEQSGTLTGDAEPGFPLTPPNNGIANDTGELLYANAPRENESQEYDIWRVLCRGPVPQSVLNTYGAQAIEQPADPLVTGSTPRNVLVAPSCVIWSSPFSGDEFVAGGTITDPSVQTELSAFVSSGGRLYVEGMDIGFALTNDGAEADGFYTTGLNALFKSDSMPDDDAYYTLTGAKNQTDYISWDAFTNNSVGTGNIYPEFSGPVGHENFKLATTTAADVIPNWTYQPPAAGPIHLAYDARQQLPIDTDQRTDCSLNSGGLTTIGNGSFDYVDEFTTLLTAPATTGPVVGAKEASELHGGAAGSASDQLVYTHFAPPTGVDFGGGITAYSSFGIESVGQEVATLSMQNIGIESGAVDYPIYSVYAQRTNLMHNLICFLRTGTLTGKVTNTNGGAAQTNATVVAYPEADGGYANPTGTTSEIVFTGTTNGNGVYSIGGVPAGRYDLYAYAPGTSFQHNANSFVDVHGGDVGTLALQVSPTAPGSLVVLVTNQSGNPLQGATVYAAEATTGSPSYTEVTQSNGEAEFLSVASGNYILTVNGDGNLSGYGSYTTPAKSPVSVTTGVQTSVTVVLTAAPGTVTGRVVSAATGNPISGAVVTATPYTGNTSGATATATTDASGDYSLSALAGDYTLTASAKFYLPESLPASGSSPAYVVVVSSGTLSGENFSLKTATTGTIYGLAAYKDGTPIQTTVTLTDTLGIYPTVTATTNTTTTTGPDGSAENYSITGVYPSTYTVSVSASGVAAQTVTLPTAGSYSVRADFSVTPVFSAGLNFFSLPYSYASVSGTTGQLFGYADPVIALWNPSLFQYGITSDGPVSALTPGVGYWIRFPHSVGLELTGAALPTTSGSSVSITLQTGWNMIGDPYLTGVTIGNLTFTDENGNAYSFDQASGSSVQLINPVLYYYNPGNGEYEAGLSTGSLTPYMGYWIETNAECTMTIPAP
jgi:hypothetical protein